MGDLVFNWQVILGLILGGLALLSFLGMVKLGKKYQTKAFALLIVGFAFFGYGAGWFSSIFQPTPVQQQVVYQPVSVPAQTVVSTPATSNCPSTLQTVVYYKAQDTGASTVTYVSGAEVRFKNKESGELLNASSTTSSTGYVSTGTTLSCGKHYSAYLMPQIGSSASDIIEDFVPDGQADYIDFKTVQLSGLQFRVKDLVTDSYLGLYIADQNITNSTSYTNMNTTRVNSDTSGAGIVIAADGYVDYKIYIKTISSNKYAFDPSYNAYACVDSPTDKWQEPVISYNGVKKVDAKSGIRDNDKLSGDVSGAEYCYKIDNVGDTENTINYYQKTASGVNPANADRQTLKFFGETLFVSSKKPNDVLVGGFQDNSGKSEVLWDGTEKDLKIKVMTE